MRSHHDQTNRQYHDTEYTFGLLYVSVPSETPMVTSSDTLDTELCLYPPMRPTALGDPQNRTLGYLVYVAYATCILPCAELAALPTVGLGMRSFA